MKKLIGKFMGEDLYIETSEKVIDRAEKWFIDGSKKMCETEVDPELAKLAGLKTKTILISK